MTRNEQLVLDVLAQAMAPLSAYQILDRLRPCGLRGPMQVYRALDHLCASGLVHRLESLKAFIACPHPGAIDHLPGYAICEHCMAVAEIDVGHFRSLLRDICTQSGFWATSTTIEIRGLCGKCAARPASHSSKVA